MNVKKQSLFICLLLIISASFLAACGNPASLITKDKMSGTAALDGGACRTGVATPLVVDMPDRSFLEGGMQDGIVFVKYNCQEMIILADCKLPGEYAYSGLSRKEELVSLENKDELSANLPFSGGKGQAKLDSGSVLNIGLMSVGRRSTAAQVSRSNMVGSQCGEATHYVKQAILGAFSMRTAQKGSMSASVQVFAVAEGSGSSSSNNSQDRRDGDINACKSSSSGDTAPLEECQAILRLMLIPVPGDQIAAKGKGSEEKEKGAGVLEACPTGLVYSNGKCGTPKAGEPTVCQPDDADDCLKQCNAGNAKSCYFYGSLLYGNLCADSSKKAHCDEITADGNDAAMEKEEESALVFYKKACDADIAKACNDYAGLIEYYGNRRKDNGLVAKAISSYDKACQLGSADACSNVAAIRVAKNEAFRGLADYDRACKLGETYSCLEIGGFYFKGEHVSKAPQTGFDYLNLFCEQGNAEVCLELGQRILGTYSRMNLKDPIKLADMPNAEQKARKMLAKGCKLENGEACFELGRTMFLNQEFGQAKLYFEATVTQSQAHEEANVLLGEMAEMGLGMTANKTQAINYWIKSDNAPSLFKAANALDAGDGVIQDKEKAGATLARYCEHEENDQKNCMRVKTLNPKAFEKFLITVCYSTTMWACDEHLKLDKAKHMTYLKSECGDEPDPTDFYCKRIKTLKNLDELDDLDNLDLDLDLDLDL